MSSHFLLFIFNKVQSLTSQIFLIKQFSTQRKDLVKYTIVANIKTWNMIQLFGDIR